MIKLIPKPKSINLENEKKREIGFISLDTVHGFLSHALASEILEMKLWDIPQLLKDSENNRISLKVLQLSELPQIDGFNEELFKKQGYTLAVTNEDIVIQTMSQDGFVNALSTLKQLIVLENNKTYITTGATIIDWPSIEVRSVSNTFAWYAGYGRIGFDMQLWGLDQWKEYLNICSDYKINQFNMCMYGYWPFKFEEYPETELKDYKMEIWNEESKNWIQINYVHPNISKPFLHELMEYGRKLGFSFFAYIGLNSYNGGYPSIYKEKRMKLPADGKFVNDFDTLCLSDEENLIYLDTAIRKVVELGFDGIDFEESEEAYWFCNCSQCTERYLKDNTPADAKHKANFFLLNRLYKVIKKANPDCVVGLRAWREPPLEKDVEFLKYCSDSIPDDVVLFWAPGLYVNEDEFPKWIDVFGKHRIYARDTEANAVASTMGRLMRIFKSNVIRADEETNHQYIEKDIEMHKDSVKFGVKGINGYMFEWYGYFLNLFVHGNYGWGSVMEDEEFYEYSIEAVFGEELKDDILFVLKNMLTIHESQFTIFPTEFPFLRNKVGRQDIPTIEKAIDSWSEIHEKILNIKSAISNHPRVHYYTTHFEKIEHAHLRNRYIYQLALASIAYDQAQTAEEKREHLLKMDYYNEQDFNLVKTRYFDVNPVSETGTKSCMYPYHELKRVIHNELYPEKRDDEQIFLGVEALGWLWL